MRRLSQQQAIQQGQALLERMKGTGWELGILQRCASGPNVPANPDCK